MKRSLKGGGTHQCSFNPQLSAQANAMTCSLEATSSNALSLSQQTGGKKKQKRYRNKSRKSRKGRKSRKTRKTRKARKAKQKRKYQRKTKRGY